MDRGAGACSVVRSVSSSTCSCMGVTQAWRADFTGTVAVSAACLGQEVPILLAGNYPGICCCSAEAPEFDVPALVPLLWCKSKSHFWPKTLVWRSPFCFPLQRDH